MTQSSSRFRARIPASTWPAAAFLLLAALGAALLVTRANRPIPSRTTLTAGSSLTSRALIARSLTHELQRNGVETQLIETPSTYDELDAVRDRKIDFAIVSSVMDLRSTYPDLREVMPLFDEALHLLVRREHLDAFADGTLRGLRGLRVDLGPPGSATALLSEDVLRFAEIPCAPEPSPDSCTPERIGYAELLASLAEGDRADRPDAVFDLGSVPSRIGLRLIQDHDFGLVPLPFADSFRLGALLSDEDGDPISSAIQRRATFEFAMPPYLYDASPPIPATPIPTIGAHLVLVAHRDLPSALVERVVETALETRFARVPDPPLERKLLERPPGLPRHAGTRTYLARERPIVVASDIDRLANGLSVLGALLGAAIFGWRIWTQRAQTTRAALFTRFQLELADLERRIAEIELSSELDLEALAELHRNLLQLKSDALARFSAGELGDRTQVSDLLAPLNAARDHVSSLLLYVRQDLEKQALRQGRTAESVWDEAIEADPSKPNGPTRA